MPRPCKRRACRPYDGDRVFKPRSLPMTQLETIRLELGEFEAIRLCDLDGWDQEAAGRRISMRYFLNSLPQKSRGLLPPVWSRV